MPTDDLRRATSGRRRRLGAELAYLRRMSRIGGRKMAAATGLSQSSVSRVESGLRAPSRHEVDAWLHETGADDAVRDRVLALVKAVHAEATPWRELLDDHDHLQDRVAERERSARLKLEWSPDVVPGLLQTRAYAQALMPIVGAPGVDHEATVEGRLQRQRVLYEPERRFDFLLSEHALHRAIGNDEVMAEQRAHLERISGMPGVTVAVVPEPMPIVASSEFMLYDELEDGRLPFVAIELTHGSIVVTEPEDVALYRSVFRRLADAAHPR